MNRQQTIPSVRRSVKGRASFGHSLQSVVELVDITKEKKCYYQYCETTGPFSLHIVSKNKVFTTMVIRLLDQAFGECCKLVSRHHSTATQFVLTMLSFDSCHQSPMRNGDFSTPGLAVPTWLTGHRRWPCLFDLNTMRITRSGSIVLRRAIMTWCASSCLNS